MRIDTQNGLLFVSLTIHQNDVHQTVPKVVLTTGAAHTIINLSAVEELDIGAELGDEFVFLTGLGGKEPALRKSVDLIEFGTYSIEGAHIDFAYLDAHPGISGLLGADILMSGRFVIDLDVMDIYQKGNR